MKRLFLVTHKMTGGGCERVIAALLARFVAEGVSCTLVTECNVPSFYALPEALATISLLDTPDMRATDVPRAYRRLRALVKRERPDAVLAMPEKVNVWTVLFLLGTGVPVVVSERNDPRRHPENRIKRLLRRLVYPFAAGFIFQTQQAADYFPRRIRARGIVLMNPLDTTLLPPPNLGARERTVVGAGRLHPQKNFPLLIRAFAAFYATHPEWRLLLYGEGSERAALLALAGALLPPDAFALPGQTARLPEKLAECGMFVLSSDYEGMPNALIEAMAVGAPCIASDCPAGGCAALVTEGKNGLLFPVGGEAALKNAMARVAEDPALARSLGEAATAVREALSERVICQQWRQYLAKIAAK